MGVSLEIGKIGDRGTRFFASLRMTTSDVVRQLAAGKDFLFSDRGAADLKGFDEPVRLFEVAWKEGE